MGELPRSLQLVADRTLVGAIAPGTRVTAVGIYSIYQARTRRPRRQLPPGRSVPRAVSASMLAVETCPNTGAGGHQAAAAWFLILNYTHYTLYIIRYTLLSLAVASFFHMRPIPRVSRRMCISDGSVQPTCALRPFMTDNAQTCTRKLACVLKHGSGACLAAVQTLLQPGAANRAVCLP